MSAELRWLWKFSLPPGQWVYLFDVNSGHEDDES